MAKFTSEDFDNALDLSGEAEWMDTPKGMAKVSNELVGNILGVMDDSIIGDALRIAKGKPTRREVEDVTSPLSPLSRLTSQAEKNRIAKAYLEANTILQQGQQKLKEGADYWQQQKSAKAKAQDKLANDAVGALDTLEVYAQNPSYTLREVVSQAPQLVPMILGARGLSSKLGKKLTDKLGVDNRGAIALADVGYQSAVGGQQAREQSLQDSKDVRDYNAEEELAFNEGRDPDPSKVDKNSGAASRYQAARIAADSGATTSALAGLIGLKGDAALTNLLLGQSIKGLSGTGLKAAGKHLLANTVEEAVDEAGSPLGANIGASNTYEPSRDLTQGVGKSAVQGGVIGLGMGSVQAGSLYLFGDGDKNNEAPTADDLAKSILNSVPKQDIPKQYQDSFNAFEDAKQAEAQAQAAYEANPTPESEEALAQATDARLKANNQFSQYDAAFKQTFTEQEQQDLLANSLSGIAARAKLAEEAKQAELNSKAEQEALAKAQRANMVKGLAAYADNESVLINEVNQLGLDDTQKELLLREVFAERKNAKAKPQQANGQPKTPLELAVDEHFDAKGNRKPSVMSSDVADKHKVSLLNELLPAIAKRNNDIKIQKAQAEKQAKVDAFNKSQAQQKTKDVQREQLAEQQQLENILADFAAENDTDSMLSLLDGYENKAEADKLFNNAFKTVETRAKEAEKATRAKEAETAKQEQAKQKQSAFSTDMSALYESNPNATYNDWKAIGKKYGVTSAIDLASAWANARTNKPKQKDEQKPKNTETLALPAPDTVMVADAQGNVIPTTENNVPKKPRSNDFSVPSGLKVDVSNAENTQSDLGKGSYIGSAMIVRQDGQPFPTEQVAQQALANKATKKPRRKNEPTVSKDTHSVVPVDGGFAIAPKSEQQITQEDIIGEYARDTSPNDIIKLVKTETGYELDFDGISTYYDGEDSLKKAKSFLRKYGFKKIKPKAESEWQATPKEPVVEVEKPKKPDDNEDGGVIADAPKPNAPVSPAGQQAVDAAPTQSIEGEYQHSKIESAKATVTKTDKGYDVNWGDDVQSFTGKNAAEKTQAALKKENFNKKNPDNDNGGVPVEPVAPKPVSPMGGNSAPQTVPKSTGQQIASAFEGIGKGGAEKAHISAIERIKNGEEIVYKQPAAIERAKQDDRYQVEINDKGHAVVKNIKDSNGEWVKKDSIEQGEDLARIEDAPKDKKKYKDNVVSVYLTQGGQDGFVIKKQQRPNGDTSYSYEGKWGAGSGHSHADMLKIVNGVKASKRAVKLGYGVEFELIEQSGQKAEQPKQEKQKEAAKDFERESQNNSELNPQESKQPTKKESLLIKIDDELDAALDDFAAIFKEQGKRLSSGVDPVIMGKVLAIGMKASTLYLAKGAVKFAVWAENIIAALSSKGVPQDAVQPYLKGLYAASKMQVSPEIRKQMDKEDDVYDFDFAILNESAPQTTPKTDAEQIRTIGSKEDGLIASKFREDLKSFLTKIDEIDVYENEPSDLHKFSTFLTNEILQKRAENQDDLKGFISKSLGLALDGSNYIGLEGAFNDRSRINAVEEFLYKKAKSTESLSFENKEKEYSKTEKEHSKSVERIRKGEEIVYKKPDAIERAKQDDRYQVEINDKGHAVVKNIKDSNGEWVKPQANVTPTPKTEAVHIENGKAEEVTPEIIRESLAKVDDKPVNGKTMSLKEAKQWLLDQVTVAISVAKYKNNNDVLGENGEKNPKSTDYVTFDVPNDGSFNVLNSIESLQKFKKKVKVNRGFDKQSPVKPFPAPSQNPPDTTIAGFLGDGELDNAYEYSKLKGKPIRFGVDVDTGKIQAYALTESVDLAHGLKGFVGLSLDEHNTQKPKQWFVIEESTGRKVNGLAQDSKQSAIASAKEKLSQVKLSPDVIKKSISDNILTKNQEQLEAEWLSQIGYNPNQNDDDVKADVKAKVEDKQNKAIADDILNQEPEKVTTKAIDEKPKDGIIKVEYPTATVLNGWQNSSRNANELVRSFKRAYEDYINEAYNGALSQAETDAQKKVLEKESLKLQKEYIKRTVTLAQIRSGVTSSFIAGGSNFNNKQAQNRGNAFDKASRDFENWLLGNKYTLSTAVQEARSPEQLAAIKAEKDAKAQRLQDKNDDFLRKVLSFKKGDDFTIGKNKVVRVNVNKYGMPISLTLEGDGLIKGLNDKISLFGKNMSYETVDDLKQNIERVKEADAIDNAIAEEEKPTPVTQPESEPTPTASTSSSDLGDNKAESEAKQQPAKEEAPKQEANSKTPTLDKHNALMDSVRDGKATAEDFKQSFADIYANKDAILLELNALTKDQLLKEGGYAVQYRHKNDKKSEVADAVYHSMIAEYALGRGITYGMGKNSYENAAQKMVESTDQQRLDDFAQEYKQMIDGRISDLKAKAEALKNPQTLDDFRMLMRSTMADGKSRQEAFLSLSAEHRIKYDELEAESTKEARETRKRAAQASINTSSQVTDGKIIETKHTRDGYDLFVVQLSDRLSTDDYKKVLSEAKKLGGWYSSYKGGGAIVGFQFKDKEAAQAFLALAGGDTTAAKEQLSQKQDDYEDNRSQSAAERLLDMADKIETKANEELDRDRKANTARRAKFAMSAENEARAKIALAKTMRNIAEAIKNGKAKFLDNIRMKVDVEALRAYITTAKDNEIRSEYDSYAEQVKRKGQPATAATADFATYPTYTLFRSDLAFLGRQLLEIDGLKKLGQQIMMVADDVSDAYLEFAKKNLYKVSRFQTKDSALATFSSKETAERAIKKSGLTGKAIVLQVKRGENIVILSPSEAINLKVWEGDADKRITLKREFGNQLVESVGRRAGKNNRLLPYQFQYAYDKLKALSRMGIETPSEFRSALREFIALQEEATNNKVREMEMAMVGRKKDGLDFFPTPQAIAQQMIDSAEITPDMAVLEPSAGMGHIADMIRATGAEPDVIEMSGDRRELLQEKGYHLAEVNNFMNMQPREFFTYGDVFVAPDGKEGIMVGVSPSRVRLEDEQGNRLGLYNRDELTGVAHRGSWSGYDRIIMNPPFSNRQDAEHVRHAYELLRPNGRIVAIMGEGVFFGSDKKAVEFREWLDSVGGTSEKLPDNSFMDKSLPVNTGVNARMVIIDKQESNLQDSDSKPKFSQSSTIGDRTITQVRDKLISRFGKRIIDLLESKGILKIHQSMKTLPKGVLDMARGTEDAAYYNGVVHLIADNLTPETVVATFIHELGGHKGFQEMMSPKAYELIMQQFDRLVKQGNAIALEAKARAERAESITDKDKEGKTDKQIKELEAMYEARQQNEYIPYFLTEQVTAQEATPQERNAVKRLIDHILRAVKGWVVRTLSKYSATAGISKRVSESLTPADILYMAERMVKDIAKYGGDNNRNTPQFSKTEQAQFDQLLAKADKMIAEQGKLLAPNGKPSKLNRVQWAQVRTDNFKAWFGDWENDPKNASKVVDSNGEPMVVYHGTNADFNKFKPTKPNFYAITEGTYFFTDNENVAANFGKYVISVYLNIDNPTELDGRSAGRFNTWELNDDSENYGWIVKNSDTGGGIATEYAVENPTQIKSAIGNNGEFSPTNPDIRFSRGDSSRNESPQNDNPSQQNNNKKLNSLLHGWLDGKGEDVFNAMSAPIKGVLSKMPASMALVDNAPPAFKQMMREMLRDSKQAELVVSDILKNSTSLKAEERTLLSDYLEKELALGVIPPEDVVKIGAAMRMALSYQTEELVRLGMLSEESAARWRDTYLPRLYKERQKDPLNKAIVKRFDIKGDHLKGRGQYREVETSKVADYVKSGWEDRGVSSRGKTIVWRDYTKEEREKMGEVRDAMLRFAIGFLSTQRDIATAKLFEKIASNEELASSEPVAGWVQVPKAFIQQTGGLMRYGKLSGMWVHPDVWENTKHYIQDRGDIERIYRKTLAVWKEGKTVLNVVAHTNNVVSNVVMVTAAGANINDIRKGYDSLTSKDKFYQEAVEMGMMATGHYTGDIRDYFGDDLLGATTPTNLVFKAIKKAWENPVFNKMRELYDLEDQMFKLALYRKSRELGASQQQAVDYAETFIFNYADLPIGVKRIRDFGLPFISYTYKAVPAMTRLAFTQPHRMLAITAAAYGINTLAYAMLGLDGDDEEKERASMPDYMQGHSAWGIPKLIRTPFGDADNPVFLDFYRWLPLGDFFTMNDRTGGVPIPTSAVLSGPYWNAYNTLIANRNGLTGGDYFEDTDSDKQTFAKSMRFGLSEWIPMYYHLDKNLNAVTREFEDTPASNLLNAMGYSGTNARGESADLANSLLGVTGIKVREFDIQAEREKKYNKYEFKIRDLKREIRSIGRDMSNTHQERDIEDKFKEIERLLKERDEMAASWE